MAAAGPSLKVRIGAGVAAFLLVAGVLLSFLPSGNSTSSTTTSDANSSTSAPSTTVSPEDYERIASGISDVIDAAGTDRCQLISAFTAFSQLPQPSTEDQVRSGIELTSRLLIAAADSAGADETTDGTTVADSLRATVTALQAEAETEGYSPEWLNTPPGATPLTSESFAATLSAYQQRTAELCNTGATAPGSAPAEGPVPTQPGG